MPDEPHSITVRNLTKRFGKFTAVDSVSFSVKKAEIFGFLGPNGAGKSTTIRMLCGILTPTSGEGTVAGFDILRQSEQIKKCIGYMSQRFSIYPDLTVEENLDFYGGIYGVSRKDKQKRKDEICRLVGLEERRKDSTSLLTGGWRQRLALGCALLHNPPVVFLDEPTSGVDPISRRDFWEIIRSLSQQGVTILVTTHYMEEAEYCQRLALISSGRLVASGTPRQLKDSFGYKIYYLECDSLVRAMKLLSEAPGFLETSLWGAGLHVVASSGEGIEERIRQILERESIKISHIKPAQVSLEDVFVYKVGEESKG